MSKLEKFPSASEPSSPLVNSAEVEEAIKAIQAKKEATGQWGIEAPAREAAAAPELPADDPHDAWSAEAFETHQDKMAELRKVIENFYGAEHSLEPDQPIEAETFAVPPAPASPPTSMPVSTVSEQAVEPHRAKERAASLREQLTPTVEEIRAGTAHLGRLDEFSAKERHPARTKKGEKVAAKAAKAPKARKGSKLARNVALAGGLGAAVGYGASQMPHGTMLEDIGHAKYGGARLAHVEPKPVAKKREAKREARAEAPKLVAVKAVSPEISAPAIREVAWKSEPAEKPRVSRTPRASLDRRPAMRPARASEETARDLNLRELEKVEGLRAEAAARIAVASEAPQPAIAQEEASPSVSAPEAPRAYGTSAESYTVRNSHLEVRVDPTMPAIFADRDGNLSVFGGSPEEQQEFAHAFLIAHPSATLRIMIPSAEGALILQNLRIVPSPNPESLFEAAPLDAPSAHTGIGHTLFGLFRRYPDKVDPKTFTKRIASSGGPA